MWIIGNGDLGEVKDKGFVGEQRGLMGCQQWNSGPSRAHSTHAGATAGLEVTHTHSVALPYPTPPAAGVRLIHRRSCLVARALDTRALGIAAKANARNLCSW
jgi:hypothetical protein